MIYLVFFNDFIYLQEEIYASFNARISKDDDNMKVYKMMGVVFIAFVVGTLPGLIIEIADVINRDITISTDIFFWANVMINPIIYAFMNRSYKEAMYDVIFYKCKSKNPKIKKIPATNNNFDNF